jgi:hypothetical protein
MAALEVSVTKAKSGSFEGTVFLPGLQPTKLASKKDGATEFGTKAALAAVGRGVAKSLGFESVTLQEATLQGAQVETKKAAKTTGAKAPANGKVAQVKGDV